jgi:hypothetical protein
MFPSLVIALRDAELVPQIRELLDSGLSLAEILDQLGVIEHAGQAEFIAQLPMSMQTALLAIARENLAREHPKQMMFSWRPGYDWELRVWESTSSSISAGGITVQIASRYPDDPHPGFELS